MKKNAFNWLAVVGFLGCFAVLGQNVTENSWQDAIPYEPDYENWTKEEVRAYNQRYKAALEARARELGLLKRRDRGFKKLTPERQVERGNAMAKRIPGTSITYHSGTLGTAGLNSQMVGNQFNTALNPASTAILPIEVSGSITMVTFDLAAASGNVFLSFYHQLAGTTAAQITSMSIPAATGLNTHTISTTANAYSGGTFLGGIWQFTGAPGDTPAVATGTILGQGFHGISINDGGVGSMFVTFSALNAAFSATGNLATPVELMNFKVE